MRLARLFSIAALVAGCSAVLPLGDEYTFDDVDASVSPDASPSDLGRDDAPVDMNGGDAGPVCETDPTMEQACADRCGEVVLCEMTFVCGGCAGELACGGAGTANECGCAEAPCAVASFRTGDLDRQTVVALDVDRDGNVFIAGDFRGTITIGDDDYTNRGTVRMDMFIAKLDPQGTPLWSRAYGGIGDTEGSSQNARALAVDPAGNVVLVGESSAPVNLGRDDLAADGDIVIVKLSGDGDHIFSATYGSEFGVDPTALAIDPASQYIFLAGSFYGTLRVGALPGITAAAPGGNFDIFLVELAPGGRPLEAKRFGDPSEQSAESIAISGNGLFLSGYFHGDFNFGPVDRDPLSTTAFYALAVTKLSVSALAHHWSRQYGTEVSNSRLAGDSSGGVFLSGRFSGSLEIATPPLNSDDGEAFLARLDSEGTTVWSRQFANVLIRALDAGRDGTLYVVGQTRGVTDLGGGTVSGDGSPDAFIAHYAADGSHIWSRTFAGVSGDQSAVDVAVSLDGTTWIAAPLEGEVDFGDGTLISSGDIDALVVGYAP